MADPLSAIGSVAGLRIGSSAGWSAYIQELSVLTSVLIKLQQASDHARVKNRSPSLATPGVPTAIILECHEELRGLKSTFSEKLLKRGMRRKLDMLSWPFSEPEMQKKIRRLHRFSSLLESSLVADNLHIAVENQLHLREEKGIKRFNDRLKWFQPTYESLPLSPEIILESLCPGTRTAFLGSDTYVKWRDSFGATSTPPLWITGPPGAGKSVLSAAIVNDITTISNTAVAYHFFKVNQEETLRDVLQHIAFQLLSQPTVVSQVATKICDTKMPRNASLLVKDLLDVICDIPRTVDRVYVIMDGLDEFTHFIKALKYLPQLVGAGARIIVSSRNIPSIGDTELYVHWRIDEESAIERHLFPDDLKSEIVSKILKHTNGSFLLARLIMDSICNATTTKKIRNILHCLPTNYQDAYQSTLERILKHDEGRRNLAFSALHWICNSKRSLDMAELRHAIASLDEMPEYTAEGLETATTILSSCFGILVCSQSSQIVDFVHSSAREFFLQQLNSQPREVSIAIARACLRYIAVPEMAKGRCQSLDELKTRITQMPFLEYTTRYYGYHVRRVEDEVLVELRRFLGDEMFRESSWQMLHFVVSPESQSAQDLIHVVPNQATTLHVCSYWGFLSLSKQLVATASGLLMVNKADSHGWSPLHWASSNGNLEVATVLLEAGANIEAVDKKMWTPLFWAVMRGHKDVAQLLLDRGSNPFHTDQAGFTPVHWAVLAAANTMTALLLEEASTSKHQYRTADLKPSHSIREYTVEQAIEIRDNVFRPKNPKNLFQLAAEVGDTESFNRLAELYHDSWSIEQMGFDPSAIWTQTKITLSKGEVGFRIDRWREQPVDAVRKQLLLTAIQGENIEVIKSVLSLSHDLGKDLASDTVDDQGSGYLHVAACSGNVEILRMLVQSSLSLKAINSDGRTPLHFACSSGKQDVLEFILDADVEVDARDNQQRTPLMLLLLFGKGACPTLNTPGKTPLLVKALLAKGASLHAKDSVGHQPIHYAMSTMDPEVIQALVDFGADAGALCDMLRMPLHVLCGGFPNVGFIAKIPPSLELAVTQLVLQISPRGALEHQTASGATAFALAIESHKWVLAQALHTAKAPFQCQDDLSETFDTVVTNGFHEFMGILIKAGVVPTGNKSLLPSISARLPAQKRHNWEQTLIDVFESQAFPDRDFVKTVKHLLASGVDVNSEDEYLRSTALQIATERGINDAAYLYALLYGGADPYKKRDDGLDSLDLATFRGKLDNLGVMVRHISLDLSRDHWLTNWLQKVGTIPRTDEECFDACVAAIRHSNLHMQYDEHGHTLLFYAAREGNLNLARELVNLGTNVNFGDYLGWTPFHEAVRSHQADMVEFLIRTGSIVAATVEGTSPFLASFTVLPSPDQPTPMINALHISVGVWGSRSMSLKDRSCFCPEIVRLLLENGIDPNVRAINVSGLQECSVTHDASPLQIMFRKYGPERSREFFSIVQLLIEYGGDVNSIVDGFDVLDVATFEGYENLWDALRNAKPRK